MTADYWAASDFTPVAIAELLRRGVQSGITEFRFVCGTSAQLAQSCIRQNELLLGHLRILCGSKWWVQWVKPRRVEQLQQSSTGTPSKRPCQKLLFRPKRVGEQEVCALCGLRGWFCQPYAFLDSKIHASSLLPALAPVKLNSVPSLYVAVGKSMSRYKLGAQSFACLHIVGLAQVYTKLWDIQALLAGTDLVSRGPPYSLDTDEREEMRLYRLKMMWAPTSINV